MKDTNYTVRGTPENKIFMRALSKMGTDQLGFAFMISTMGKTSKYLAKGFDLTEEELTALSTVEKMFKLKF